MRIFVGLILLWVTSLQAFGVSVKTTSIAGKISYLIYAGTFSIQSNAESLQKRLSSFIAEPVRIEFLKEKNLFLVEVGPVTDYMIAQNLKKKVNDIVSTNDDKPLPNSTSNTPQQQSTLNSVHLSEKTRESSVHPIGNLHETKNMENHNENSNDLSEATSNAKIWNLRNADIRAIIGEVSRLTGKNFVIDQRVQGKVSIVSMTPLTKKELYQVFLSMLQVSGFAAVPSGQIIKIIPALDAKTQAPDLFSRMRNPPRGEEIMVQVIPVKYVPAEQLVPVLRPLMPAYSLVAAYPPSNMLILSGQANNIKQLSRVINQVDSSSASGIDIVPLKHALAMDVVSTLKELAKSQQGGVNSTTQVTIAADDRSNSVLLSGNKMERIRMRLIINKLDKNNENSATSNTKVIYLNYLRSEDLVPILAGIAQANFTGNVGTTIGTITTPALDSTNPNASVAVGQVGPPPSGGQQQQPTPSPQQNQNKSASNAQNEGSTKPTVQIIAEPNTNSVIVNGPESIIRILTIVIKQLDIRPAQLLIEALVAEIDEQDALSLGVEWGTTASLTSNNTAFHPGFAIISSQTSIDQLQARIYALTREQRANILSTPSVVVLDNRQAKILIGKQVSVAASTYPNNAGGTAPSGSPFTTFDRINVALHLYVRPQITHGRGIQLQIDQGNDTLDTLTSIDVGTTPTFNISSIVTSVHVESGDVVVLGGLIQDNLGNTNNSIPILSDIPGIGRLFQHNITTREKKVLMVFIRPIIIRTEQDDLYLSGKKYAKVRDEEIEYIRREEVYDPRNMKDTVLKPLDLQQLPKPFSELHQRKPLLMTN